MNVTGNTFDTVEEKNDSTSTFDLIECCKEGVIENNHMNDASFSDWDSGEHVVSTYLGEVTFLNDNPEERRVVVSAVDHWLGQQEREIL